MGAGAGFGWMVAYATSYFNMKRVMSCIFILLLFGAGFKFWSGQSGRGASQMEAKSFFKILGRRRNKTIIKKIKMGKGTIEQ